MGVKDGIEHIDTNIIVRLIVRDDVKMTERAERLISQKDKLYIFEDAAMMEVVFVLSGPVYRYNRQDVANGINTVMEIENICCNKPIISATLDLYVSHPKLSFVDCYLAVTAEVSGETPLWTFDRKLISQFSITREP